MSDNLRGLYPSHEYPSRDTAKALVAALEGDQWGSVNELERLLGLDDFSTVAERCWMVYGLPGLQPSTRAMRIAEVSMRAKPKGATIHVTPVPEVSSISDHGGYGFTPRQT